MYYLGLAPPRFAGLSGLEQYFAMARGTDDIQLALDMSKYFDTNYRAHFTAQHVTSNPSQAVCNCMDPDLYAAQLQCAGHEISDTACCVRLLDCQLCRLILRCDSGCMPAVMTGDNMLACSTG